MVVTAFRFAQSSVFIPTYRYQRMGNKLLSSQHSCLVWMDAMRRLSDEMLGLHGLAIVVVIATRRNFNKVVQNRASHSQIMRSDAKHFSVGQLYTKDLIACNYTWSIWHNLRAKGFCRWLFSPCFWPIIGATGFKSSKSHVLTEHFQVGRAYFCLVVCFYISILTERLNLHLKILTKLELYISRTVKIRIDEKWHPPALSIRFFDYVEVSVPLIRVASVICKAKGMFEWLLFHGIDCSMMLHDLQTV